MATRTPSASCKPADSSAGIQTSPSVAVQASAPALLVLADCVDGGIGLWKLEPTGTWTILGPAPDGEAIARDGALISIAHADSIESRSVTKPDQTLQTAPLKWPGSVPDAPIRAIDMSPSGSTAIVAADEQSESYWVVSGDGHVTQLEAAPQSSFTPLVAWIDADRFLTLSEGTDATSRIVVVDPSRNSSQTIPTPIGVRRFALSLDRSSVAVALDSGIYVCPVSALLNGAQQAWVGSVSASQEVLDVTMDQTGAHLAVLVGSMAADGTAESIRELGYTKDGSGWTWTYDALAPFTRALGQIWLG